jgi:AhpD family alkylhydroperoxidase
MAMMALLHEIEWERALVEPRRDPELEALFRKKLGFVPQSAQYFTASPWIVHSLIHFDVKLVGLVYVDFDLADIIGLVVSQDNSCRFCYAASRAFLRIQGYSEERIRNLEHNLLAAELSRPGQLAVEFARRVSRANPIPSASDRRTLTDAGLSVDAIKEVAYLAAVNVYYNRLSTLLAVPTEPAEQLGQHGWMRVGRPLIRWYLHWRRRRGTPTTVPPDRRGGPFAHAVLALDGLPAALALRQVIDDAWRSPALPVRTRALVFAVVARALGCTCTEEEARAILTHEGLREDAVVEVLDHLGSEEWTPAESTLVALARETVWYRPIQIQRQAHRIRRQFSTEEFIEFVGIASLANAICRLAGATDGSA